MTYIYEHNNESLDIFQFSINYDNFLIIFDQLIFMINLIIDSTFSFFLNSLKEIFLFLLKILDNGICKEKFCFDFRLCVVKLWGLFLYCIGYSWFLLENFVDHFTSFCNITVLTLNFRSPVCHLIDGLIHNNFSIRFPHNFVDLMAFGPDKKWNHSFRDKDNNRKKLFFYFSKSIKNIMKHISATLVFLLHVMVKNLYKIKWYLNITTVQVWDVQIGIESNRFNIIFLHKDLEPFVERLDLLENFVGDEDLESKDFSLLKLRLIWMIGRFNFALGQAILMYRYL